MGAAQNRLPWGAQVQVCMRQDLVNLKAGKPGEIWVFADSESISITPQSNGPTVVNRSLGTVSAGARGIAVGESIGFVSTGDGNGGVSDMPPADPNYEYTVYVPEGTDVEFMRGTAVTGSVTVR